MDSQMSSRVRWAGMVGMAALALGAGCRTAPRAAEPARASATAAACYVATTGNDAWSGRLPAPNAARTDGPFATLGRAREEIRRLKAGGALPPGGVTVAVREGTYALAQTFRLEAQDSGTAASPVTYRAYGGERPILLGGRPIGGFVPHQGRILKADVGAQGLKGIAFRQVFCNGVRQTLARYPNFEAKNPYGGGWNYVDGTLVGMYGDLPGDDKRRLTYKAGDLPEMARPTEAEVFIFPRYNWWNNVVPIATVNRAARTVTLAGDCSYAIRPGDRYYVRNLIEALDAPGEWYLDRERSTLYFWPPVPLRDGSVSVPVLETIVSLDKAAYVTLRGFILEGCDGNGLVVSGGDHCVIAACTIRNTVGRWDSGLSAVTVSGTNNRVVGCDIHDTGGHGISLSGGDRKTLTAANNAADNNYIHHVGQMYKQGVGVAMTGVGLQATHNLIHDGPRMGIMFSGNNLLIEYNEIRHVNLETEDTGAVYTGGRDWISSRGSVIRYNYFHDILGYGHDLRGRWLSPHFARGVYLDDNAGGVDVIGNLVVRCPTGLVMLHNARDNVIENNILVGGRDDMVHYMGWTDKHPFWLSHVKTMIQGYNLVKDQPAWQGMRHQDIGPEQAILPDGKIMANNRFRRNIMWYDSPTAPLYRLGNVNFDVNEFDYNCVYNAGGPVTVGLPGVDPKEQWAAWQKLGRDAHSVVADPGFRNPRRDDYRLRPESPALKLGFEPIPVEKIGPYADDLRASWPIVQAEGAREHPLVAERLSPEAAAAAAPPRYAKPFAVPQLMGGDRGEGAVISALQREGLELKLAETPGRTPITGAPCTAWVGQRDGSLFVALQVPAAAATLNRGQTWGGSDGAELCFADASGRKLGPTTVIHGYTTGTHDSATDAGALAAAAKRVGQATTYRAVIGADAWTALWIVPLKAAGIRKPGKGTRLAFNLGVRRTTGDEWICWAGAMAQNWHVESTGVLVLE
jgi:hypothetical protein